MAKFTGGIEVQGSSILSGGISNLASGTITNTEISASAAIARSKLAQDNNQKYGVPFTSMRVWNAPHTFLPSAGASDDLGLVNGGSGFGNDCLVLKTSDIDGTTVNQYARFEVIVPMEYQSGETCQVIIYGGVTAATSSDTTVDLEVHESLGTGSVATDLCNTAAQSINNTTFASKTFSISPTTFIPGDYLDCRVKISGTDDGSGGAKYGVIGKIHFTFDVKG